MAPRAFGGAARRRRGLERLSNPASPRRCCACCCCCCCCDGIGGGDCCCICFPPPAAFRAACWVSKRRRERQAPWTPPPGTAALWFGAPCCHGAVPLFTCGAFPSPSGVPRRSRRKTCRAMRKICRASGRFVGSGLVIDTAMRASSGKAAEVTAGSSRCDRSASRTVARSICVDTGHNNSASTKPSAYTSVAAPTGLPANCSGLA
mmetsp:Transcript_51594/g.144901  ORF Transcript_51594/g.144901 Transcript_51594/m.144901 type:complete len:205 (-) Transcript_51594:1251-1865(-)